MAEEDYGDVSLEYWRKNQSATMGDIDKLNERIDDLYEAITLMKEAKYDYD